MGGRGAAMHFRRGVRRDEPRAAGMTALARLSGLPFRLTQHAVVFEAEGHLFRVEMFEQVNGVLA